MRIDFTRAFPLEDISIRNGSDGRTVDAYAAVFDTPVVISDQQGTYREQIAPTAFNKTLADKGTRFQVLFNHGMTVHRTPSERFSMPIGVPLEVKADRRGVFTSTRYNATPLADEVLEGIRSGSIRGQSFSGSFVQSDKAPPRGGWRAGRDGDLPLVTRQEVRMQEYGPTPFPAYDGAGIVGVRAALTLSEPDQLLLQLILSNLAAGDAALDPIVDALTSTDQALDQAQAVLAQILGVPDPDPSDAMDPDEPRAAYLHRLQALATRLDGPASTTPTPATGAGSDEPPSGHSGRSLPPKTRIRAGLIKRGISHVTPV